MDKNVQYEYVRSMKTAALLMLQGFRILDIQPSKKNPEFDVYCFRQTPELTKALFELIELQNKGEESNGNNISTSCENES